MTWSTRAISARPIARHVVATHSKSSLLEMQLHPLTWRAISARPYTEVNLAEGEVTWLAAPEGTGAQRALVAAGGAGATGAGAGAGGPKPKKPPKLVKAGGRDVQCKPLVCRMSCHPVTWLV